ncbi:MAG TPA: hypothetical protein VGZ02_05085 [Candidatus Baltobacteraceae bacterium]|jgi:hypothetical protein|nr:hypothetical protein [Candidatus Baltobacteraceae bacterium]
MRDERDSVGDPDEDDGQDTEIDRRAGPEVMHRVEPERPRERGEAVYGDTDMDPNRDDQFSAHHATEDEHL